MSSYSGIGGYFSLETSFVSDLSVEGEYLNTARNAIEYILEVNKPSKVYIPLYTCDAVLEPFAKTGISYEFYHINERLEMQDLIDLKEGELLIYTNYFGIKNSYSEKLALEYGKKVIIDASQAFYYRRYANEQIVYSPRKFFGLPDGGIAVTDSKLERSLDQDVSFSRMSHLLKRVDLSPEDGYADFQENDKKLEHQPILKMSHLTTQLMRAIDYEAVRVRRRDNFELLHESLGPINKLDISLGEGVPLVYPLFVENGPSLRERLIEYKIFVATYWSNVYSWAKESDIEYAFTRDIIPIPIDQRYNEMDMKRILEIIRE